MDAQAFIYDEALIFRALLFPGFETFPSQPTERNHSSSSISRLPGLGAVGDSRQ